jgi:hypothetical protein
MRKSTIEAIATYLFNDISYPALVLGQKNCDLIERICNIYMMAQDNPQKIIFLKT